MELLGCSPETKIVAFIVLADAAVALVSGKGSVDAYVGRSRSQAEPLSARAVDLRKGSVQNSKRGNSRAGVSPMSNNIP